MHIRPKTIRRLLILTAVGAVVGGGVAGAFYLRRHTREADVASSRQLGMNAFEAGHFDQALAPLQSYVAARPTDLDALFALAVTREALPTANRENLFEARTRFQQVLLHDPSHLPTKRRLLSLYDQTGLTRELLALSQDVLSTVKPTDSQGEQAITEAQRYRAIALTRLGRDGEAVDAWKQYLERVPGDFRSENELLATMRRANVSTDDIIAFARAWADKTPSDPRLQIPLANALREAGRDAEARALLRTLTANPPPDADFILELVATLDRAQSFDEAESVLTRAADTLDSSVLTTSLVQRMWQNGRYAQVESTTQKLLGNDRREPGLLALRALALASLDRKPEAIACYQELSKLTQESALAWRDALAVEFAEPPMSPSQKVKSLRDSLARDPNNGIAYAWLARALLQTNEVEQAARCYREAAQRLPSWSTPAVELSQAMLDAGRMSDAVAAAKAAYLRSPTAASTLVQVARVRFAELQGRRDAAEEAALLKTVNELRQRMPNQTALIPIQIALLARRGDSSEAEQLARSLLPLNPSPALAAELYGVARHNGLAVSETIFEYAVANKLVTPQLARLRALDLASQGQRAAALLLMRTQATLHPNDATWAIADARVRQVLHDPEAAKAWRDIVAAFPNDLSVLSTAFAEAADLLGERGEQAKLLDRLQTLGGDTSTAWRLARARYLGSSSDSNDLRQALTLVTELVRQQPGRGELRVELARLLIKLDSLSTALDHLRAAFEQSPGDAAIGLEYAGALGQAGRSDDRVAVLKRLAGFDFDEPSTRLVVATALADAGLLSDTATMLGRAQSMHVLDGAGKLILAEAQAALGHVSEARALYDALLAEEHASPAALASAAAFARQDGRLDDAQAILHRLETSDDSICQRERALARYATRIGNETSAREHYAAALRAPDADADALADAVRFELTRNRLDRAETLLSQSQLAAIGNDTELKRVRLEVATLRAFKQPSGETGTPNPIDTLAQAGSRQQADALRALRAAQAAGKMTPELAVQLMQLAELSPTSLDLSRQAMSAALEVGQRDAAASLAFRILAANDTRPEAIELCARTLASAGQRAAARRAAEQWKSLAPDSRDAVALMASLAQADGDARRAINLLEPTRPLWRWPDDVASFATYSSALVSLDRRDDAYAALESSIAEQPAARSLWLGLAQGEKEVAKARTAIEKLDRATPADATSERERIGWTCVGAASTTGDAALARVGLNALKSTDASPLLKGELCRIAGDAPQAVATLREALTRQPSEPAIQNALAYLLLGDPRTASEAQQLAAAAVQARPKEAGYRDTLARAQRAAGSTESAERSFREALDLDELCLDAKVGLLSMLVGQSKTAEAQQTLTSIQTQLSASGMTDVPLHLRDEFHGARQAVTTARD